MACRCAEIQIYEDELAILDEALEKISTIEAKDTEIGEALDAIAGAIPDTLIVPDDTFCCNMKNLNTTCRCRIGDLRHAIEYSMEQANEKLEEMKKEDDKEHPWYEKFWKTLTGG